MFDVRVAAATVLGVDVVDIIPLNGGCIGRVYELVLANGERVVAKTSGDTHLSNLETEAYMLDYLRRRTALPVPEVYHVAPELLVMARLPGESRFAAAAEQDAAGLLAGLHGITADVYGFERDTLIGGLRQPNPLHSSWLEFFGRHRLVYMAEEGVRSGRLPADLAMGVSRLAERLDRWLVEPAAPSLIHGDVWTTNVLAQGGRITGFLDPAIYFADPEIELAFITLFGSFGEPFFRRYHELRPIRPGFFEERRVLYNLYPLLVHVRLFGGSYVSSVRESLARFGY